MLAPAGGEPRRPRKTGDLDMAKKAASTGVYRVTEIIGTSTTSWEDAARRAVETASKTLRDLRVAEVRKLDMTVENGKVAAYRARVSLSFKYEG
jgi:flavin-binding protein dodecin